MQSTISRGVIMDPDALLQDPVGVDVDLVDQKKLPVIGEKPHRKYVIEPVLALFMMAFMPSNLLVQQFVYIVISGVKNLTALQATQGNESTCDTNHTSEISLLRDVVQSETAYWMMILNIAACVPAVVTVLFYGAYSDKIGRKLPMILPPIGQVIKCLIYICTLYFPLPVGYLIFGAVVEGLFGGMTTMMMSCMSYLADQCDPSNRTIRITIIEVVCGIAAALAQISMGFEIQFLGYLYPFIIIIGLHVLNIMYIYFFVREIRPANKRRVIVPKHFIRSFKLFIFDDPAGKRNLRLICLGALIMCDIVVVGRWDPLTLFELNAPLCWTSVLIGFNGAALAIGSQLGDIGLVALFIRRIGDGGVAAVGCISGIAYFLWLGFVTQTWEMFVLPMIGCASFVPVTMMKSALSKLTPPEEQGALFAGLASVDTLCGLTGTVLFNPIYSATLKVMSGAVFLVMAGIEAIGLVIVIVYLVISKSIPNPLQVISDKDVNYGSINESNVPVDEEENDRPIGERA